MCSATAVWSSPLTRALQTALVGLAPLLGGGSGGGGGGGGSGNGGGDGSGGGGGGGGDE